MGASERGEAETNEGLLEEHEHLSQEARVSSGSEAGAYIARCGLGTSPRGGCCPSCMLQVASPKEGYAAI